MKTIKWVENFKYLGSMMLSSETDIKIRKGQAWGAFLKMKDIWKSIKISLTLKINIFKASWLSILLYGSESWIITQKLADSLNSFCTNCYRIMQNIIWQDKISNETLYKNTKQEPIVQTGIASEETRKNSPINMPSIHHSLDMENANKVDQNYFIPNI